MYKFGYMLEHPKAQPTDKVKMTEMNLTSEMGNQQERWAVDAARLAMLFDTDGCITMRVVQRMKNRVANVTPYVGAVGTYHNLIEWATETLRSMGVPTYIMRIEMARYNKACQPQSRLTIQGMKRVAKVLPIIRPYLIAKPQQADLLQEFINLRMARPHKAMYSDRELDIANEIRSLNSNKGGAFRPISSESIRRTQEMREHLKGMMCSDLRRDAQSTTEMIVPAVA